MNYYSSMSIFSAGELVSRESGLFVARYCRSIFSLSLTAIVGLVSISPAWSLTVTAPGDTLVAAGRDYATEILANPWDFDGPGDIETAELRNLTAPTFSGGVLRATTTGPDANIWMIYQGVASAFNLTRGARHPIDNGRFTRLSLKMRLSMNDGSPLSGSNRQMNAFFYEDENAIPDERFGFTRFLPFPDDAWHIVAIDLTDPNNIGNQSDFLWTNFDSLEGFRIDPTAGLPGVDVELAWARLTEPASPENRIVVTWSDADGPVDIAAVDRDGASLLLAQQVAGNSADVALSDLAPGEYRIQVDDGNGPVSSPGLVSVAAPPLLHFTDPDIRGDTASAYGIAVNGNGWSSLDSGDIERVINVENLSYSNPAGTLYGRPTSVDPSVVFFTPDAIDSDRFRMLCYSLEVAGPRNIRDGSVARIFWGDSLNALSTSEDIVVQDGVNEYCVGDLRNMELESGVANDWTGVFQWFRLDPHEFTPSGGCPESGTPAECRDFRFHGVTLAPLDTADPSFFVQWRAENFDGDTTIDLFLDPDRDPNNGNEIPVSTDILATDPGSAAINFSGIGAAAGEYWLLGSISNSLSATLTYSSGPLRLASTIDDLIFADGFETLVR